jgi:membrane protein DedA with SNARE-associated domain
LLIANPHAPSQRPADVAMLMSLDAALALLAAHAYLVVFLGTLIDATGTPFPGRLLLITAGGLAATGDASVAAVIGLSIAGAVTGDHLWYLAGRLAGGRVTRFYCRIVMRGAPGCVERARASLARFGPLALIAGRFMAGVRIVVTPMAAESGMPYLRYALCDLVGASLWCSLWVLLGFGLGVHWAPRTGSRQAVLVALGAGLILAVAIGAWLIGTRRAESRAVRRGEWRQARAEHSAEGHGARKGG